MAAPKLQRLAHLVIRVRDLDRSIRFYTEVLGLELKHRFAGGMAFLNAPGCTDKTHELALQAVGPHAPGPEPGRVGLYHFAWQAKSLEDLEAFHRHLVESGTRIVGYGHHGVSFGVYFLDPDGNEVEVGYELPREQWPDDPAARLRGTFPLPVDLQPAT